jgi:glycosyltransferase 2 family protein
MTLKLVNRLGIGATIGIFCAAIVVLVREFAGVSPSEVLADLAALPKSQLFGALGLTAASYMVLTGYDFLALCYVQHRLRFRDLLFASFTAFAFSNSVGFQLLSGGSIRYSIYSRFGLSIVEIGEIVAFCTFTYALGVIAVSGLVALFDTGEVATLLHLPRMLVFGVGVVFVVSIAAFPAAVAIWREPIAFGRYRLRPPSWTMALLQIALASIDAVLAAAVMYVLLPPEVGITFRAFLDVYLVAATASVLSLVPGGLGVFETVVTVMTAPTSKAAELGAFLTYRMIYFIAPLTIAIVWFAVHEFRRREEAHGDTVASKLPPQEDADTRRLQ